MATYYVRADGASSKAGAIGPTTDASKCMSMATLVTNNDTFLPDDIIVLSSRGGDFTSQLAMRSNGTAGHEIIIRGEPNYEPSVVYAGTAFELYTTYVKVENIHCYNTNSNSSDRAIYIRTGVGVKITGGTASAYYYGIVCGAESANGIDIDGVSIVRAYVDAVYIYGAGTQNVIIKNLYNLPANVKFKNTTNIDISDIELLDISGQGVYILDSLGAINISNVDVIGSSGEAILLKGCSGTQTVSNVKGRDNEGGVCLDGVTGETVISNCVMSGGTGSGFKIVGASDSITMTDCVASGMAGDGFVVSDSVADVHDVTFLRCMSAGCGNKNTTTGGDGFTAHAGSYNLDVIQCLSINNTCSGFAMVHNTSGSIINCTAVGNASDYTGEGGLNQVRGGLYLGLHGANPTTSGSWVVRNTIFSDNYPYELNVSKVGSSIIDLDYNCYNERTAGVLATLDSGATTLDWDGYASNESNSIHADPLFANSGEDDYRLTTASLCVGAGAIVTGVHDQATPAGDYNGDPVVFTPNIGAYDGRTVKALSGNYSPTGYEVRTGAKLQVAANDITIDLTGLTNNEAVEIQARSKTFTPLLQSNNIVRAKGGGGRGMGLGL